MGDITHIERSNLPWHDDERVTECGLDAAKHPTWSRAAAVATCKEMGKQRFSLFVCMTCMSTAERHSTWEEDPASCMGRYTEGRSLRWRSDDEGAIRFANELRAIALLIEAHRDEFDEAVAALGATRSLDGQRAARRYGGA
jgi:hypothetical protein